LRIACFNMLAGGSAVHWSMLDAAAQADVLLVQETKDPARLHSDLEDPEFNISRATWAPVAHGRWGSAIYLRHNHVRPIELAGFSGWVTGGETTTSAWGGMHIYSVHLPPDKGSYVRAANRLLDTLVPVLRGTPVLLGGDFNLTVGVRQANETRQNHRGELPLLQRLKEEFDLFPAWSAANAGQPLPQTLRWTRDQVTPYHCDGVFVPLALTRSVDTAQVLSGSPWLELSDYNPVVVDWSPE
jgi:exonuclease III